MKPRLGADFRLIIRRILFRHNDFSSCASTCAVVLVFKDHSKRISAVCKSLGVRSLNRTQRTGRDLQTLPQALVHQNFDIYPTVELAAMGVLVADNRMGRAIAAARSSLSFWSLSLLKVLEA